MTTGPALDTAPAPAPLSRRVLASLNVGSLGVAIGFGVTAALMLSPLFVTPFVVLLGRSLFLALMLLLVFVAARELPERWLPTWLPRWLLTVLAVGVAAPLGTLLVYLVSVGGSVAAFVDSPARLTGFVIITGTALALGLLITFGALLREREARARSLTLELELQRSRLEKQALDARLALLQAQIEPHFLFNTLANVQALVESNSPRAADVLRSLVAYLRAAMPRLHDGQPTLGNELALVQAYLELMQMRMPDRLAYSIDATPDLHRLRFPAMAVLTLVENAVCHGIDPGCDGGRIEVGARREAGGCRLWVADTGVGLSEHATPGTGLANLRARLLGFFGAGAELRLSENTPRGLRAEIVWTP
ncbi:MAG: histidine kinase [Rubrivivax sp.]|nr:histidine kinase [Rubrivivax sp.]